MVPKLEIDVINWYIKFVLEQPVLSSAVQVALLGTVGELLAVRIRRGQWRFFGPGQLLAKVAVWAFLGITFKYAFAGFFGFVDALVQKGLLFSSAADPGLIRSFYVSVFTNLLFGPVMMLFHRWTDNLIERKSMDWNTMQDAWKTLLWFWIPAHTVTFSLPAHLQVGLAALWAVVLGVILGYHARKRT